MLAIVNVYVNNAPNATPPLDPAESDFTTVNACTGFDVEHPAAAPGQSLPGETPTTAFFNNPLPVTGNGSSTTTV